MIQIYGIIGQEVKAEAVLKQIQAYKGEEIDVYISSDGGDVFQGIAIYDALRNSGKKVTCYIMGIAASAASIIAMAGDKIVMGDGAMLMIHNSSSPSGGNAENLKFKIGLLEKIDELMAEIYQNKTGLNPDIIKNLMAEETYITAEEAVKYGFINETENDLKLVALATTHKEKTKEGKTMDNIDEDKVSVGVVAKILNALGFAKEMPKAEDAPAPMPEEEKEEETEPSEMDALKAELEALKAENESLKAKVNGMEEEKTEEAEQAKSKEELIFTALQENKVTVAKAKELFAMADAVAVASSLESLQNNANGFGSTGQPKDKGELSPEAIYAMYEQADEKEKFQLFKAHKNIIMAQASKKG